jgi:hypothetical protein
MHSSALQYSYKPGNDSGDEYTCVKIFCNSSSSYVDKKFGIGGFIPSKHSINGSNNDHTNFLKDLTAILPSPDVPYISTFNSK